MLDICVEYGIESDISFNPVKSVAMQIGLREDVILPSLLLNKVVLQWVVRLKYLGVFITSGIKFTVDCSVNRTKFLGSVFGILQKCSYVSDEIKWNVVQHSCLPILLYGVDSVHLSRSQVYSLSVALNTAVRRCFRLSRCTSVRNILFFTGALPINMLLNERKILLLKDCMNCSGLLGICARIATNSDDFLHACFECDVHCDLSKGFIKSSFKRCLFEKLQSDGLV